MSGTHYFELLLLAGPESILVVAALLVLAVDLLVMRGEALSNRLLVASAFACLGCCAAIFWMLNLHQAGDPANGMLVIDPLTRLVKMALLTLTIFAILLSVGTRCPSHPGEYLALILLATVGLLFMVSSEEILMIFVSLELTSLSLYVLTAFRKDSLKSAEAALKYFLFGGMSAAFSLFGLSLLYGLSGATNLKQIAIALGPLGLDPLLLVAIIMTVIGFGFKIAAVPFHLWAPDAYEGAPTPIAALIASGSKVASFFLFAKVMILGFDGVQGSAAARQFAAGWAPVLATIAALSMLLGNLAAIAQTNVKRLLAYSAIAHAGYALLGILANPSGMAALVYYVVTYALTALGAFGVVAVVEHSAGDSRLSDFFGLSRRAPVLSLCMMIFMLSLAGIPPLAGFFGKFYLFTAAAGSGSPNLGLLWLVIFAIAMSAVSLYYYLKVLKQIYLHEGLGESQPLDVPLASQIAVGVLAMSVIALGCAPDLLLGQLVNALKTIGFH